MSLMLDFKNIVEFLISQYDLEYDSASANSEDYLFRWCDFLRRYVSSQERETLFSKGFWDKLTDCQKELVHFFCSKVEYGEDINPYQSKGLCKDGLSKSKKTDLLYAEWGILHFHLTKNAIPVGKFFSDRSKNLLFALVSKDTLTGEESFRCLEVCNHNERDLWSKARFLKRIVKTWPDLMAPFVISNSPTYNHTHNSKTIKALRNANVNSSIVIDGIEYMPPNSGITAAGTSFSVTREVIRVKKILAAVETQLPSTSSLKISSSGFMIYNSAGSLLNSPLITSLNSAVFPNWCASFINGLPSKPSFWV